MSGANVITYRPMNAEDYARAFALWQATPGMGLDPQMDSGPGIRAYLAKNPGLSLVAEAGGELIATILGGTDGRRGYLMHLAVRADYRRRGIARALVERAIAAFNAAGIDKIHVFVFRDNTAGLSFWRACGWQGRDDIHMLSLARDGSGSGAGCCNC